MRNRLQVGALALFWFVLAAAGQQQGSVTGQVVDAATGQPLSRVHVRLLVRTEGEFTAAYGALSGSDGRFSISPIPAGAYLVQPERTGYFFAPPAKDGAPSPMVTVAPGRTLDLRVEMAQRAVIAGVVRGAKGEPVTGAIVSLSPAPGQNLALEMLLEMAGIRTFQTDDGGEFRMSVPAGRYHLWIEGQSEGGEIRSDGTEAPVYAKTYYPSVKDEKSAAVIEARAGKETAIEVRMLRQLAFRIAGTVTGAPADGAVSVTVFEGLARMPREVPVGADGSFVVENIGEDSCTLSAHTEPGSGALRSAAKKIAAGGAATANVTLALRPPLRISGALQGLAASGGKPMVTLAPVSDEPALGNEEGVLSAAVVAGAFEIGDALPRKYLVTVSPMSEDGYVKSVRLNGVAAVESWDHLGETGEWVRDPVVDLSEAPAGSQLAIAAGNAGARLSGRVEGKAGPVGFGTVLLVPEGKKGWRDGFTARLASDGRYSLRRVPPGKYRILAIDAFGRPEADDALDEYLARAEAIEVKDGDRIVRNLRAMEKEGGDVQKQQ